MHRSDIGSVPILGKLAVLEIGLVRPINLANKCSFMCTVTVQHAGSEE